MAYDILVVVTYILLLDACELEQGSILGIRVTEIYSYQHIVGVLYRCVVEHTLVLVAVVVEAGGDIAQHGRACRVTTRTTTKHKLLVVELALDNHTVELVLYTLYIFFARDELRHYAHYNLSVLQLFDVRHQLVASLLLVCEANIVVVHRRDTVRKYLVGRNVTTEGVYGDDNQLKERVPTSNIKCRVALGEAQLLCATESHIVGVVLVEYL